MNRLSMWWALAAILTAGPAAAAAGEYRRSLAQYTLPDVTLVDQQGARVKLKDVVPEGKPVFVQFVFTSCPTICPILGAIFSSFQAKVGPEAKDIRFVSISIDPEHDDPARMQAYLKRYHAQENWTFLTGAREDIALVQRAFDAGVENRMSHTPLTFFFSPAAHAWVRIGGFIGASELVAEYQGTAP
jgi:protein SCO1